jgi:hypothetical protein
MLKLNQLAGFGSKRVASGYDSDAQAFFTATGITDSTQKNAVNQLVLDLKSASIWSKLLAIYPLVGGDSTKHSYNLKATGSYQVTWTGAGTHDANGYTGGSGKYGDTGFNQATNGAEDDEHLSIYFLTNAEDFNQGSGVLDSSAANGTSLIPRGATNTYYTRSQCSNQHSLGSVTSSLGYFSINRTASSGYRKRVNGSNTNVTQDSDVAIQSYNFLIGARNVAGTAGANTNRTIAWFCLGRGLTESEDGALQTAVETFQDALSRGVV